MPLHLPLSRRRFLGQSACGALGVSLGVGLGLRAFAQANHAALANAGFPEGYP